MTKSDFVAQLQSLSGELGKAIAARDFDRVRFIDACRQELIQQFAADVTPDEDPEFFSSLECISEDIANSIATLKMEIRCRSRPARNSGCWKAIALDPIRQPFRTILPCDGRSIISFFIFSISVVRRSFRASAAWLTMPSDFSSAASISTTSMSRRWRRRSMLSK